MSIRLDCMVRLEGKQWRWYWNSSGEMNVPRSSMVGLQCLDCYFMINFHFLGSLATQKSNRRFSNLDDEPRSSPSASTVKGRGGAVMKPAARGLATHSFTYYICGNISGIKV